MATEAPPPSYEAVISKVEQHIGNNLTPEKFLHAVSNLTEKEVAAVENTFATAELDVDSHAFRKGMQAYLDSEAARTRLKADPEDATKACQLIETMFGNLAVKLGEVDSKNLGSSLAHSTVGLMAGRRKEIQK